MNYDFSINIAIWPPQVRFPGHAPACTLQRTMLVMQIDNKFPILLISLFLSIFIRRLIPLKNHLFFFLYFLKSCCISKGLATRRICERFIYNISFFYHRFYELICFHKKLKFNFLIYIFHFWKLIKFFCYALTNKPIKPFKLYLIKPKYCIHSDICLVEKRKKNGG